MLKRKSTPVNYPGLEDEIARLISELEGLEPTSTEYKTILKHITKLDPLNRKAKPTGLSKDAMLGAAANIVGILLVLNYEQFAAVVSKAFSMIQKAKI